MFSIRMAVIALLLSCGFGTIAQNIAEISYQQIGKHPVQQEYLNHNTRLRKGMHFDAKEVDEDIKRLYQTGIFADIQNRTVKRSDGNVNLLYKLKLKPVVRKLIISGNEKLKDSAIREKTTVEENAPLNERNLRDTVAAIRKLYKDDGYNDAQVNWNIVNHSEDEVTVKIQIRENLKVRVNNVQFIGVQQIREKELKEAMANRYNILGSIPWLGKYLNAGLLDREELAADEARLRDVFWKYGYLDAKIVSVKVTPLEKDAEQADITIKVEQGQPYTVGKISVNGVPKSDLDAIRGMITVQPKKTFAFPDETASVRAIQHYYESLGNIDAVVRAVRFADAKTHVVNLRFEITPGRSYRVRRVNVVNNIYTKDKVIRRELAIQPGDPVDRSRIEVSKSRLMGMGYFTSVEATTANADDVNEKDVEFHVVEKDERFNFKVGAGFSDVNSFVGMAEISNNNFDLFSPEKWFYGGGQRFRIQGLFGIERAGANIDFTEPWLFDLPLRLDVSGYWNDLDYDNWSEQRIGVRTGLTRKFLDDFTSATLGYKFERVKVYDMARKMDDETQRQEDKDWVSQFSLVLNRDTRDSLMNPTQGYNLNFLGAVAPKIFGSSNNFYRLEAKASGYYSFWDKAITVMAGLKSGVVSGFNRMDTVPLYERYFLGGGDSLRGFSYRDVSPLDKNGNPIGGNTMLLGTFEVSHPIWRFIRGAAFVDAGNVWQNAYSFGSGGINVGAGYGLRLQLPMINAPIKLDLAYPIVNNQDELSSKFRFHFNMGFTW